MRKMTNAQAEAAFIVFVVLPVTAVLSILIVLGAV